MSFFSRVSAALAAFLCCALLGAAPALAQETGSISGVVVDAANGESLPGANVSIKGTTTGTATDLNGRYRIKGVEVGTYDLVFSFIGFQQKTITGVEVAAGETTKLDVTLAEQTAELDEVIVEAEAARDSDAGLLMQRAKAAGVSDAISAETISKAAASNAADAMEKVTGASITDGKYVNVRGLGGRYVNTQLNGSELPSSDPDKNAVPLDIFPAGLLDNIVTSKTFTPDKPGNFTGGSVNLSTQSFPSDLAVSVSASTTYNSEVEYGDILSAQGGLEEIPAEARNGVPAPTTPDPSGQQRLDEITRSFTPDMTPVLDQAPINQSYSISFGNGYEIGDQKLGVVAGGTYSKSVSAVNNGVSGQYVLNGDVNTTDALFPDFELGAESGSVEDTYGGLLGLSYSPGSNNELSFNALVNRSEQSSARSQQGSFPRDLGQGEIFVSRALETVERTLYSLQLRGDHLLLSDAPSLRVDWQSSYTNTQQNEPDVRFFNSDIDPAGSDSTFNISPAIYPQPTRYFRELSEYSFSNDLNLTIGLGNTELKVGGRYRVKDRTLDESRFIHATVGNVQFDDVNGNAQEYFGDQAGIIGETSSGNPIFGTYISDVTQNSNNFNAQRTVGAGYVMIDTPLLLDGLRLVTGGRIEYTNQFAENAEARDEIIETDFLPSTNLVYAVSDNMNVRAAYGRTLARPSFREFAPFEFYDFINNELTNGNGDLERTTVNNFDLRWEWFTRPGEIFAASAFLKDFTDPIERTLEPQAVNREVTFENQESALVYGMEVEARKRLDFLSPALEYLEVGGNFTLTHSSVSISDSELEQIREKVPNADDTRPLQGQSPFLANFDISYDNPEMGTTISAFYNYFADRLDTIERAGTPNQFEDGRHTIDVTASQQIYGGLSTKLSVKNILNEEYRLIQTFKGQEYENNVYQLGRTVSLSFKYDL
jgi:TonB-dependent receptor